MELPRINLPKGGNLFTTKKRINSNFRIKNIFYLMNIVNIHQI